MTTTIRDVAKKAGVGLGTVSRVLNNSSLVSEETRQRVQEAIRQLDYVPNPTARRLSLGKTLTITVVVPWFTRPAEVERLRGIEHTLSESEYDLILYNVESLASATSHLAMCYGGAHRRRPDHRTLAPQRRH